VKGFLFYIMKTLPQSNVEPGSWIQHVLGDQNFRNNRGFFAWWYRLTSPPDPPVGATFRQRDHARRGRIASALMLFLGTVLILAAFVAYFEQSKQIFTVVITVYVMIAICIPLNRRGFVDIVGILLTLGLVGGMYNTVLTSPGGLNPGIKDVLYMLFFSDLFVSVLLPVNWVFLVAALNIAFSVYALDFELHTTALNLAMANGGGFAILFRLIQIHIITTGVMWIVVNIVQSAIRRADRAEELARAQNDVADLMKTQATGKVELEQSIAMITEIHRRVANGDLSARVPLTNENVLWQIAGQLNNLLSRYQSARVAEQEVDALRAQLQQARNLDQAVRRMQEIQQPFSQALERAAQEQRPFYFPPTMTPADYITQSLNGRYVSKVSHSSVDAD
jgi:hypothetical protein